MAQVLSAVHSRVLFCKHEKCQWCQVLDGNGSAGCNHFIIMTLHDVKVIGTHPVALLDISNWDWW